LASRSIANTDFTWWASNGIAILPARLSFAHNPYSFLDGNSFFVGKIQFVGIIFSELEYCPIMAVDVVVLLFFPRSFDYGMVFHVSQRLAQRLIDRIAIRQIVITPQSALTGPVVVLASRSIPVTHFARWTSDE
jgi:hypothetical protein